MHSKVTKGAGSVPAPNGILEIPCVSHRVWQCGVRRVQHSVVWLSNAMRSLVGLCIARQCVRAPAGIGPVGCLP